ncbi:MAG: amidase domain-containing protein [Actinobacteria bacterium]|nr:amidase domain-containing protein [Actinomycetota bacterium]
MSRRHWAHMVAAAAFAAAALAAAAPAAATQAGVSSGREGTSGAAKAATRYLKARAAAVAAPDPATALGARVVPGSALARTEARVATGAALRGRRAGRTPKSASCRVTVLSTELSADGSGATVTAHAVTRVRWRSRDGRTDVEGSGIDHTLMLALRNGAWVVTADDYTDVLKAACLEAAGAPRSQIRAAARKTEQASSPLVLPRGEAQPPIPARGYADIIKYDRAAAQAYADKYALSYNSTYVRFSGADCANFASQCARAGSMLMATGSSNSGWWYDKKGTSSPSNDTYSLSWINVTKQMGFWNGRRTEWVASAGKLSRGDFIFYDWTGDGVWDHTAVVAGTNSSGQKVIDAHTTDLYRVFWKLGNSKTKYRFAKVWQQWVVA